MKKSNFLKHFAVIGGGTFINMLLGLLTTPVITRIVDPFEFGQLSVFTMYSNIALMVLCMGLDQALVRYYYEEENLEYRQALLFRCIQLPIIVSIACSVLVIVVSITGLVHFPFDSFIMVMLCTYTIVQVIYRFSLLIVRLEYKTKLFSMLSILLKASYLVTVLPLILLIKRNYLLLLVTATVLAAAFCMFISIFAQAQMWNFFRKRDSACAISKKELLHYACPYIVSMGVTTLFQAIDKMSLQYYRTYDEVGIYSSTMSLINIFLIIQSTFNTLWAPMSVEHYTKDPDDRSFYVKGNQMITVVMFFIGISLILVKDVFAVLLGPKYREAAYILPFLIFNPIMYTVSETTVNGLVFMKKSKMQVVVAVGACVTNIIGNTLLVPELGCKGAAISTGISYIVFFTLRTVLSNRYFPVNFKLNKFYFLTFCTGGYAFYNTFVFFNAGSVIGYLICLGVLVVLYYDTIKWGMQYLYNMIFAHRR